MTRALITLLVVLSPSTALASRLWVSSYHVEDQLGVIELASDQPIGEPWSRIDGNSLRVWLPNVEAVEHFTQESDAGETIAVVQLRPGASMTAVLRVRLAKGKTFAGSDVETKRDGRTASIRIRLPLGEGAKAAKADDAPAVAPAQAQPPAQPAAAPTPPPAPAFARPRTTTGAGKAGAQDKTKLMPPGAGVLLVVLATLGVFAAYGLSRGRRSGRAQPDIEVLSAKRVGNRHQIILVRALGQDHLLSCHGGRMERLASSPAQTPPVTDAHAGEAPAAARSQRLFGSIGSAARLKKLFAEMDGEVAPAQPRPPSPSDEPPFGAELLQFVRAQSHRPAQTARRVASELAASETVAGIARLRKKALG